MRVVYDSWFSWRHDSSLRFGIGDPWFFPRVVATMISKQIVNLGIIIYLKLVSAIFYQIFIFSPNESPLKTMKKVFYFI